MGVHKKVNFQNINVMSLVREQVSFMILRSDVAVWSPVDVVYLDFQKAFDKVPHQRLLLKLKAHGTGNDVINWIEKWLTHRRQRVVVDTEISNWKSVLRGVHMIWKMTLTGY